MQLVSMLFASALFFFLSFASATPLVHRRSPKFVTLPIRRYQHEPPRDLHSSIVFEQIVNRGLRRLARMTGAPEIPRQVLERNIMRRVLQVEGPDGLERRYNRRTLDDDTVNLDKRFLPNHTSSSSSPGNVLAVGNNNEGVNRDVKIAEAPTAANSLGLDIESKDVSYLATIQIGTPPRNFSVVVDSGSSDFWVGGENCQSVDGINGCGEHSFLGSNFSSSFVDSGKTWGIKYGAGSVNGTLVTDDISIAGLSLPQHNFGIATSETKEFSDNNVAFDGIMGLAQSELSNQNNPTPVDALLGAKLIAEAIVSYKMDRVRDKGNDGQITFGGLDTKKFDPNTAVTVDNINKNGFWQANMDDVAVDGQSLGLSRSALLDTGTTLILAPEADANALHQAIPGSTVDAGTLLIPCDTKSVVSLAFGGRAFNMDPRDLSFGQSRIKGQCVFAVSPGSLFDDQTWLVGATFLKNVYFSTNVGNNSMTLASLV